MTYTVFSPAGEMISSGQTLEQAAHAILTSDGREYQIRAQCPGFRLWARHQVAGRGWSPTVFDSPDDDVDTAEAEIFAAVITAEPMRGHAYAVKDSDYAAWAADAAEE
jgi:acyl-CoA reductase-like NAD-dependent aldehyde dehydrogenase